MEDGDLIDDACGCTGTMKHVHRECIERWMHDSGRETCEICQQPFNIEPGENMCGVVILAHVFVALTCTVGLLLTAQRLFTFIPGLYFIYLAVNCTVHSISYGSVCQHSFIVAASLCSIVYLVACILLIFSHTMTEYAVQGVFVALGLSGTLPIVYLSKRCV